MIDSGRNRREADLSHAGRLFVISAPSGAGKGTVIKKILEMRPEIALSISATTRAPREGESDGISYFFVTAGQFKEMISRGEFLEYAEYVGELYGTPKNPVNQMINSGKDVLLEIEVQGAKQVMGVMPQAVTIFIVPPNMEELKKRLYGRGTDNEEKLAARLKMAQLELLEKDNYDHIVVNDCVMRAAGEVLEILDQYKGLLRNKDS